MTTLETVDRALVAASQQVDLAIERVERIDIALDLSAARIALDAAREMAKLNGMAAALRTRLTRLELRIARRAGQLGVSVKGIPTSVAKWFAEKTDIELDELIDRHHGKSAASGIMKSEIAAEEHRRSRAMAATQGMVERLKVADPGETLTALVEAAQNEFYDHDVIRASELADYVSQLVGIPTHDDDAATAADEGLRIGLWDAVRKSLAAGEMDDPRLAGLPRWITCLASERSGWSDRMYVRVPTPKATLRQLQEYIELLERKAQQTRSRAESLAEIYNELTDAVRTAGQSDGAPAEPWYVNLTPIGTAACLILTSERRSA